jgi:hypothetical protein
LTKVIQAYLSETPKFLENLQQAINQGDIQAVQRMTHTLKSSSANLGALRGQQAENGGHCLTSPEEAKKILDELSGNMTNARRFWLRNWPGVYLDGNSCFPISASISGCR